jgi:hypothetical protein
MNPYSKQVPGRWAYYVNGILSSVTANATLTKVHSGCAIVAGDRKRPNPQAYHYEQEVKYNGTWLRRWFDGSTQFWVGDFPQTLLASTPDTAFSSNVYNTALSRLYEQVRGELDLTVDLFQGQQTKQMVATVLRSAGNCRRALARMATMNPKYWGSAWLQFVYGWKPVYESVGELVKTFQRPQKTWFAISATASSRDRGTKVITNPLGAGIDGKMDYSVSKRCKLVCRFALAGDTIEDIAQISSLNPVSVAWELVPYSFVVDWFYDVGGFVRNLENAMLYSSSFLDGYSVETVLNEGTLYVQGLKANPGSYTDSIAVTGSYRYVNKKRLILGSSPLPRAPSLKTDLGSTRLLNAAALLSQLLPKR